MVASQNHNAYYKEHDVHNELRNEVSQSSEELFLESEVSRIKELYEKRNDEPVQSKDRPEIYVPPCF